MTEALRKVVEAVERLSLFVALAVVLLIAGLSYQAWSDFARDSAQARSGLALVNETHFLLLTVTDAETGQRGFLLTGEPRYLGPYEQARLRLPAVLQAIQIAAASQPEQPERVALLIPLVTEKMGELAETLELRRASGLEAAMDAVRTDHGKASMDRIRAICGEIQTTATAARTLIADRGRANANRIGIIATFGSAGLFALLALATATIRRSTVRRQALIAELHKSEAVANDAREWLETTIGSIGDGVIATDEKGQVVFLNRVATQLTGWTQEQAAGVDLEKVFVVTNEDTGAPVENPVRQALREGRVIGLANHTRLARRAGGSLSIDDSAAPIRTRDGRAIGVVLVFRDVTEERAQERERERSRMALASANKDLQQFAYAASHDLREPLRTIKIFTQILQTTAPGLQDTHRRELEFIVTGADRMESLVDALLAYSTAGADTGKPATEVDVQSALEGALENLRAAIDQSHAVVTHAALPKITGDEAQLILVFQNLIGNSIKYRRGDAPRIQVGVTRTDSEWILSVQDDGIGIDPDYHESIFGIFKRLHDQSLSGSGIGLATCRRIIERCQGRIWVESRLGEGSTFFFSLPLGSAERKTILVS